MEKNSQINKSIKLLVLLVPLIFLSIEGFGQFAIKGRVVDAESGQALEFATVFINNSTFGAITNQNGGFEISIPPGSHELVVSYMGYQPFTFAFSTATLREFYEFRVLPEPIELDEAQVAEKRDRAWYSNQDIFMENFLGTSINAGKCRILNPGVLVLDAESEPGVLKASAKDILDIQNPNLGYRIKYVLTVFEYHIESGRVSFAGYPFFVGEDLPRRRAMRLEKNREKAFRGSISHLMRSLYLGITEEEGFELFTVDRVPNPDRPDGEQVLRARAMLEETRAFLVRDSLRREIAKAELPEFVDVFSETPLDGKEIIQKTGDGKVFLTFDRPFYVIFKNEVEEPNYRKLAVRDVKNRMNTMGMVVSGGTDGNLPQTTRVQMVAKAVQIFEDGSYFHPFDIYLEGYMAWEKIGDLMPFDYGMK